MNKITLLILTIGLSSFYSLTQSNYDSYLRNGINSAEKGNFQEALEYFNLGIKEFPDSIAFYNGKGIVLESLNDLDGSLEQFTQVVKLDSSNYLGYFNRARVYRLRKEHKKACSDYRSAYYLGYEPARKYYNEWCGYISDPNDPDDELPPIEDISE